MLLSILLKECALAFIETRVALIIHAVGPLTTKINSIITYNTLLIISHDLRQQYAHYEYPNIHITTKVLQDLPATVILLKLHHFVYREEKTSLSVYILNIQFSFFISGDEYVCKSLHSSPSRSVSLISRTGCLNRDSILTPTTNNIEHFSSRA